MKCKQILGASIVALALTPAHAELISLVGKYDATTGAPIAGWTSPGGGGGPRVLAISGNTLYVSDFVNNTVSAYNATTGATIAGFTTISGLFLPHGLAVSGNTLYVSNDVPADEVLNTVGAYNATTGAAIPGFTPPSGLNLPFALAVSGNNLYVANNDGDSVEDYDVTTGEPVTGFTSPIVRHTIALTVSGNNLYVGDYWNQTVGLYDATTGLPINADLIPGLSVSGLAVLDNHLYVSAGGTDGIGVVGEYDATTGIPINANLIRLNGGALTIWGNSLYIENYVSTSGPEPTSATLLGLGALLLAARRRRA